MLEKFLADPTSVGLVGLMAIAVWAFFTNAIVTAKTLAERDAMFTQRDAMFTQALAERDKQIVSLQQRYDEMQAIAFRLADITDRTQAVVPKAIGLGKP